MRFHFRRERLQLDPVHPPIDPRQPFAGMPLLHLSMNQLLGDLIPALRHSGHLNRRVALGENEAPRNLEKSFHISDSVARFVNLFPSRYSALAIYSLRE